MAIETAEVRRIATLARLRFDTDEEQACAETLSQILDYVNQLAEVDTADVEPTTHAVELETIFRPDRIEQPLTTDAVLQNAPASAENQFSVPKVVEDA